MKELRIQYTLTVNRCHSERLRFLQCHSVTEMSEGPGTNTFFQNKNWYQNLLCAIWVFLETKLISCSLYSVGISDVTTVGLKALGEEKTISFKCIQILYTPLICCDNVE